MPHGTDPFRDRYSSRAVIMTGSKIRALFEFAQRPEIVSLSGGLPYTAGLAADNVLECAREILERDTAGALQYGATSGTDGLRDVLAGCMAREGIDANTHEILVTDGAQQGLDLLGKIFIDPGDVILAEGPTYVGALAAFGSYQAEVRCLELDDDGLVPQALAAALDRLRAEARRAKFLYLVPTFQNPSGVTLSAARRPEILELCAREQVLVIEDNPYALLRFEGEPVPPLRTLAPDNVIYLGTLSKVFAPGVRIGWVLAPEPVRDRLAIAKEAADLCTSPFMQLLAETYMRSSQAAVDLDVLRKTYGDRRDAMLDALAAHFPADASARVPEGGLFLWVTVPGGIDSDAMLARALDAGVAYLPGTGCYPDGRGTDSMRLNFSFPSPEQIGEGIRRLGRVIADELELARSLGG